MGSKIELLSKSHKKEDFECGKAMLDNYIHCQAGQDMKRKLSVCFVWVDFQDDSITGYYTLANQSIPLHTIPAKWRKKLPVSYSLIPVTLLGRLAVDKRFQGKGIGELLLFDALKRSYKASLSIGSFAVVVDPLDNDAEMFYAKHGFDKLPDSGKMFMAMSTVKELFHK